MISPVGIKTLERSSVLQHGVFVATNVTTIVSHYFSLACQIANAIHVIMSFFRVTIIFSATINLVLF